MLTDFSQENQCNALVTQVKKIKHVPYLDSGLLRCCFVYISDIGFVIPAGHGVLIEQFAVLFIILGQEFDSFSLVCILIADGQSGFYQDEQDLIEHST